MEEFAKLWARSRNPKDTPAILTANKFFDICRRAPGYKLGDCDTEGIAQYYATSGESPPPASALSSDVAVWKREEWEYLRKTRDEDLTLIQKRAFGQSIRSCATVLGEDCSSEQNKEYFATGKVTAVAGVPTQTAELGDIPDIVRFNPIRDLPAPGSFPVVATAPVEISLEQRRQRERAWKIISNPVGAKETQQLAGIMTDCDKERGGGEACTDAELKQYFIGLPTNEAPGQVATYVGPAPKTTQPSIQVMRPSVDSDPPFETYRLAPTVEEAGESCADYGESFSKKICMEDVIKNVKLGGLLTSSEIAGIKEYLNDETIVAEQTPLVSSNLDPLISAHRWWAKEPIGGSFLTEYPWPAIYPGRTPPEPDAPEADQSQDTATTYVYEPAKVPEVPAGTPLQAGEFPILESGAWRNTIDSDLELNVPNEQINYTGRYWYNSLCLLTDEPCGDEASLKPAREFSNAIPSSDSRSNQGFVASAFGAFFGFRK